MDDVRPMAHIDQFWAHRNAQRGHTPREILIISSSLLQYPLIVTLLTLVSNYMVKISLDSNAEFCTKRTLLSL
jgi:hypothetical protein